MKALLIFLFTSCLAAGAWAQSPYAGNYCATIEPRTGVVGAFNFNINSVGTIKGRGAYTDSTSFTVSGSVTIDGKFTIVETSAKRLPPYSGKMNATNKSFTVKLSTGNTVRGGLVPKDFRVAGAYTATTSDGLRALFVVTANKKFLGGLYEPGTGKVHTFLGLASLDGFGGSTETGIYFQGTYIKTGVRGTYSKDEDYKGTFSGIRL